MTPLKIIFSGSGEFGLPTLRALIEAKHQLVQIYSQPDRPAGRGRKLTPTPIAQFALQNNLPLIRTANINAEVLPPADVMVVIAFGQKIAEPAVHHPRLGSINLHASLLPKYRGAAPIHSAILNGDTVTGNSVIRLAQKMDAGDVLGQSQLPIHPTETTGELHDRLANDGPALILRVLDELAAGNAIAVPQDPAHVSIAPKLSRESTRIDWSLPAGRIANQIRGLSPWPACRVRLLDAEGAEKGRLTLLRARAQHCEGSRWSPGEIMMDGSISAGEGGVEILEVQPESGRPMDLATYRNGHIWQTGLKVESI